ncbi:MAG: AtpZ/AtpI family protein [Alphaproteobacteria bacterium]|jgi:ATP synthase protein I|nr:AtpZ/AtpI family protein [Alphaproteobacteria bacterium]MBT5827893.1 AtpZ/AtpI family protein [Alphaproteobacteria bacterium]
MQNNLKNSLDKIDNGINYFKNKEKKANKSEKRQTNQQLKYTTQVTVDLLSGLAVGAFIGYELDKFFQTKPLCFIVFMVLGIAGGTLNLIRNLNK